MSYTKSLRWRIQFWQLVVLLSAVSLLLVGFYLYEKKNRIAHTDMQLAQLREPLFVKYIVLKTFHNQKAARQTRLPKYIKERRKRRLKKLERGEEPKNPERPIHFDEYQEEHPPLESDRELLTIEKLYAKVWGFEGQKIFEGGGDEASSIPFPAEHLDSDGHFYRWRDGNRELVFVGKRQEVIVIGKPSRLIYQDLHKFAWMLVGVGGGITFLALLAGWAASRKIVRPIVEVCQVAERISGGSLDERIPTAQEVSELQGLVEVLNQTFDRLSKSVQNQVRFTADASHELRTPLTIILNEAQWVLEKERAAEQYQESAEVCEQSAQHMRMLIEALLELARYDAGDYELAKVSFSAHTLVAEVCSLLASVAEKKGVILEYKGGKTELRADEPKVKQILINLVNNAIQHTPVGGRVSVSCSREGEAVVVEVQDSGVGISDQDKEHIFERFYRGEQQINRRAGGTGLGLAISQAIVKAHGGEISVHSALGKGSTFRVTLP